MSRLRKFFEEIYVGCLHLLIRSCIQNENNRIQLIMEGIIF